MRKGLRDLKGLRDFVVRGNVIDLAVGFVVGVAFTTEYHGTNHPRPF